MTNLLIDEDVEAFAAPVGRAVLAASNLESALRDFLAVADGSKSADEFDAPVSLMIAQAKELSPINSELFDRIQALMAERHVVVHGHWWHDPTEGVGTRKLVPKRQRQPTELPWSHRSWTTSKVEALAQELAEAVWDVERAQSELSPPASKRAE